jgi:hypothetical protein
LVVEKVMNLLALVWLQAIESMEFGVLLAVFLKLKIRLCSALERNEEKGREGKKRREIFEFCC